MKTQKKLLRVYGKKPRASKSSIRITYKGFAFFLHRSKGETAGHIMLYWDKEPYPHIKLLICNADDSPQIVAEHWLDNNMDDLIDKLQRLNDYAQVPKEFLKKINVKNEYVILTGNEDKSKMKLAVHKHEGDFVYMWCDINEAPTLSIKGSRVLDSDKIYEEYLKRNKDA